MSSYYENLQVGVVPGEKLLELLEIAMSSNTAETVKRSRELIDSGIDPIALMSQLAGLIMDRIAGTYRMTKSNSGGTALGGQNCECIRSCSFMLAIDRMTINNLSFLFKLLFLCQCNVLVQES